MSDEENLTRLARMSLSGLRDYQCYWRRLQQLPFAEQMRVRKAAEPLAKLYTIATHVYMALPTAINVVVFTICCRNVPIAVEIRRQASIASGH